MGKEEPTTKKRELRLCNEIQLFDLCDLEQCRCKEGRFCTNEELLAKFELISEEDSRLPPDQYTEEVMDDDDDGTCDSLDDEDEWEDE